MEIRYDSEVVALCVRDGVFRSARVASPAGDEEMEATSVVVASGGFESNLEWLRRYWGDAVDNYVVRGTSANDGW